MNARLCSTVVVLAALAAAVIRADSQAVPYDPYRAGYMRAHFAQAMVVHTAVIRGDLPAVAAEASMLADAPAPASLPEGSEPHLTALRQAARKAADAKDIVTAAYATALMLNACGDCHRAVGTMPAAPSAPQPTLGGVVGHMLGHQRAVDQMLQGLVIPSTTLWQAGARAFASAPLHPQDLPVSGQARQEMMATEERMHRIATSASQATESRSRASFYSQMLSGCADCHKRHLTLWGPKPW